MDFFKKNFKTILIWTGTLVVLVFVLRIALFTPYTVTPVKLTPRDLQQESFGIGTVEAKVVVKVGSKITGRITNLYTDQGLRVKKGDLIATLENDDFQKQMVQAEHELSKANADIVANQAAINQAEANLKLAKNNYGRYKKLLQEEVISQLDFDQRENEYQVAEESVKLLKAQHVALVKQKEKAEANVGFSKARLVDTYVYSPCDGLVVSREAEAGDAITAGAPIYRIADTSVIWILAYIDETVAGGIQVGNPAKVILRSKSQQTLSGKVARVEVESDRVTEERAVNITFDLKSEIPPIGEQAEVYIITAQKKRASALPRSVLVPVGTKYGVWVLQQSRVHWREVRIGIDDPSGWIEIVSGLQPHEQIATAKPSVMMKLAEGSRVTLQN